VARPDIRAAAITPNMLMSATTAASESRMVKAGTPLPPCQNPAPMGRGVAELVGCTRHR
jgi:hypothetical protein